MKPLRPEQKTIVKRGALLAGIMLLLVAAAWVNGILDDSSRPASASAKPPATTASATGTAAARSRSGDYFQDFRSDRAAVRKSEIELLDEVIAQGKDSAAAETASAKKVMLTDYMESEFALEKTLLAKGYDDVAVILRESLLTIAIKKAEIESSDAAKILEAARLHTGMDAANIKIIPVE